MFAPMRSRTVRALALGAALALAGPLVAQPPAPAAAPLTPFAERKARALLERQLPCLGCHELDGTGGRIGPSLTSVAQRRSAAYIEAMIADPQRVAPGSAMPKTPMPAETRRIVTALLARGASPGTPPPPSRAHAPAPAAPEALYARWCAACHGAGGAGDGPNAKHLPVRPAAHASAAAMAARPDDALYDAIAAGGAVMGKSPRMPAFGETLAPAEIRSLVVHIRTLCACEGPAWSRDGRAP